MLKQFFSSLHQSLSDVSNESKLKISLRGGRQMWNVFNNLIIILRKILSADVMEKSGNSRHLSDLNNFLWN